MNFFSRPSRLGRRSTGWKGSFLSFYLSLKRSPAESRGKVRGRASVGTARALQNSLGTAQAIRLPVPVGGGKRWWRTCRAVAVHPRASCAKRLDRTAPRSVGKIRTAPAGADD